MSFEIGLSCSGGVSAGAYIAGVLDFLFQALDEWEKAKSDPHVDVPRHSVTIKVLTGASAGAISAAVSTMAIARGDAPRAFAAPQPGKQAYQAWAPLLYETWVVWPRLVAPPTVDPDIAAMRNPPVPPSLQNIDFLTDSDLTSAAGKGSLAVSLLNCQLLNYIAARAVQPLGAAPRVRAYLPQDLHIYLTTTNNRGIPFALKLQNGDYPMVNHADRAHYRFSGLGTAATVSEFGQRDPAQSLYAAQLTGPVQTQLPVESLLLPPGSPWADWYRFGNTILASAAFPIGLAPRSIAATRGDYAGRLFPQMSLRSSLIAPVFPPPDQNADYIASDGGVIDNDPIEYAIAALPAPDQPPSANDLAHATQAVIMIAPFPDAPTYPASDAQKSDILHLAGQFFTSLRQHVRFKPDLLLAAADENVGNRFMVAPRRTAPGADKAEPFPLASGVLGGFGGFIHRAYRDHDFQLGRRNCQKFLMTSFMLKAENPVFEPVAGAAERCIIPLCGSANDEVPLPVWPKITPTEFDTLKGRIDGRIGALRGNIAGNLGGNWLQRQGISGFIRILQALFMDKLFRGIESGLKDRGQL
ncbi:hypothetical protein FHW96_004426 [Novosphingobium sp. SG751A]|uniref:patatin-like phospholipase family protein n=1 Tax=Novosphingobium sp. SG751A TaxID=2587000 RepID=UPI001554BBEA|nr:patatin-like phospholipase family protein [Novosphingobium sp. SG751A]NOW48238.1 hypothetical protein [Novosphingobium sp. SG751A]